MNTRMKKVAAGAVIVSLLVLGVVLLTVARGAYGGMMRTSAATSCPATAGAQCSMSASQCAAATASGTCPAAGRQGTGAHGACPMRAGTAVPACHAAKPGSVG
jgi:hypothetical protein